MKQGVVFTLFLLLFTPSNCLAGGACSEQPLPPNRVQVANGMVNTGGSSTGSFASAFAASQGVYVVVTNRNALPAPITVSISTDNVPLCSTTANLPPLGERLYSSSVFGDPPIHFKVDVSPGTPHTNVIVTVQVYTLPPPQWVLMLFNSDDYARASINGKQVLTCPFAKTCSLSLNGLMTKGTANQIVVETVNTGGGYTYGWQLNADGQRRAGASCGKAGSQGCNNNATTTGVIFHDTYAISFW